jgi:chromosome partitioning protein
MKAKILSVMSMKGGVGKSTLSKFTGINAAKDGKRTLIIDLCQNADISTQFNYNRDDFKLTVKDWIVGDALFDDVVHHDKETGVDFLPSNRYVNKIVDYVNEEYSFDTKVALKEKIDTISDRYSLIICDTHPDESSLMMVLPLAASDMVLVPTKLNYSSVVAMQRTVELIQKANKTLSIQSQVVVMDVDIFKMSKELGEFKTFLKEELDIDDVPVVKKTSLIDKMSFKGKEFSASTNQYAQQVMEDFQHVYEKVKGRLSL